MKMTYKQVLEAALTLGKNDRRKLREQLNFNLEPQDRDVDEMNDDELYAELERRHQEFLRDPSVGIPIEDVLAKLDREYADAGHPPSARRKRVRESV